MHKECRVCGRPYSEVHHVVLRKQQKALEECPYNKIILCYEHHRGNKSPHGNRSIDLKYKMELQEKLTWLFGSKEVYTEEEVQNILMINKKNTTKLLKPLKIHVDNDVVGHAAEEIIRQAMGGKLYG